MPNTPVNYEDEEFVPRRPKTGDELLSSSGVIVVSDILGFHRQGTTSQTGKGRSGRQT
jgi:hypothetical protein